MSVYYPILMDVQYKRCMVVGGGAVAERKIAGLMEAKAKIIVVSPLTTEQIDNWARDLRIQLLRQHYHKDVLAGSTLVFAATNDRELNREIFQDAKKIGAFVSMADDPVQSDFILPAVVRRGKLIITASTSGASPQLSTRICNEWAVQFGDEYEMYVDFLSEYRMETLRIVKDGQKRKNLLQQVLNQDILSSIKNGEFAAVRKRLLEQLYTADVDDDKEGDIS